MYNNFSLASFHVPGLRLVVKRAIFPGVDLHTRCRYRFLARWLSPIAEHTLDAGFGNGALALAATRRHGRVIGISLSQRDVDATAALLRAMAIPEGRIQLRVMNVYDLRDLGRTFDQIICSETLEHISRDAYVIDIFAELLNPGGRLILCSPYALHPEHRRGRFDGPEDGGHVRDGYTLEAYRNLLEPVGLQIVDSMGLGGPLLCGLDRLLRLIRARWGTALALPVFAAFFPLTLLDRPDPRVPFSLAVLAEKRA